MRQTTDRTIDDAEVAHFDAGTSWWDLNGDYRWMHRARPLRMAYVRDHACRHFQRNLRRPDFLTGLRVLDIGCGGGIFSEALAQAGAAVVGADPARVAVAEAKAHAGQNGLAIDYRCATVEMLARAEERFDMVIAFDVVEHVADWEYFLEKCAELVKPGGLILLSTASRTLKSYIGMIVLAEYAFGILPRGSHQWARFLPPADMRAGLERGGLRYIEARGVGWRIFGGGIKFTRSTDVNYMLAAARPA